jgi:hypothetical protein
MSFEKYAKYCNKKRQEIGAPAESEADLEQSYRAYLTAIRLSGRDLDIRYERQPDSRVKQIFVPKAARVD